MLGEVKLSKPPPPPPRLCTWCLLEMHIDNRNGGFTIKRYTLCICCVKKQTSCYFVGFFYFICFLCLTRDCPRANFTRSECDFRVVNVAVAVAGRTVTSDGARATRFNYYRRFTSVRRVRSAHARRTVNHTAPARIPRIIIFFFFPRTRGFFVKKNTIFSPPPRRPFRSAIE